MQSVQSGLRVSRQAAQRIKRSLNIAEDGKKYDNIRLTPEGVIKICSQCQKQSEPAKRADQIPPLTCEQCENK
jgi:hypothetical protein